MNLNDLVNCAEGTLTSVLEGVTLYVASTGEPVTVSDTSVTVVNRREENQYSLYSRIVLSGESGNVIDVIKASFHFSITGDGTVVFAEDGDTDALSNDEIMFEIAYKNSLAYEIERHRKMIETFYNRIVTYLKLKGIGSPVAILDDAYGRVKESSLLYVIFSDGAYGINVDDDEDVEALKSNLFAVSEVLPHLLDTYGHLRESYPKAHTAMRARADIA